MKAIIQKGISALLLMVLFYFGMAWAINAVQISGKRAACWINPQFQRKGGQEFRLTQDWQKAGVQDVLVYGSSHAYRGYDPREFEKQGFSMFTLGSGFQNTLASYVLMKNEFQPKKGQLIIIDLFDKTFEGDGVGCYTRWIENANNDRTAVELVLRKPDLRTMNSLTCRMFSKNIASEVPDEEGYLFNGYCPKYDTLSGEPHEIDTTHIQFNPAFAKYLEALIQNALYNYNTLVFVSHPQPKTKSFMAFHAKFREFISPILNKYRINYFDYNSDHSLETRIHFADANHLNQAGVSIFNQRLIDDLISTGLLKKK
jgi:hypothetical protein